jgi:hypothetical protein
MPLVVCAIFLAFPANFQPPIGQSARRNAQVNLLTNKPQANQRRKGSSFAEALSPWSS